MFGNIYKLNGEYVMTLHIQKVQTEKGEPYQHNVLYLDSKYRIKKADIGQFILAPPIKQVEKRTYKSKDYIKLKNGRIYNNSGYPIITEDKIGKKIEKLFA